MRRGTKAETFAKIQMVETMSNCITEQEFNESSAHSESNYYMLADRWQYYKEVIRIIDKHGPFENVLELGPAWIPVVHDCDTFDNVVRQGQVEPTHNHNLKTIPWPIKDKQYDLVIALQVWEHIYNNQIEAFGELMRIAKAAIMSFPYEWQCRQPTNCTNCHCGITRQTISAWTHHVEPVDYTIIYDTVGMKHKRMIYYLEF